MKKRQVSEDHKEAIPVISIYPELLTCEGYLTFYEMPLRTKRIKR